MTPWRAWFDGRSLREKRLILVMLALLALTLIWYGVIRPVGDALSSERGRHADAVIRLGETQAAVAAIREIDHHRPPPLTGAFADAVRARAADAGFSLASLDEDGPNRVRVSIQSARPAALVPWLARLEEAGILVDDAALTDNGDRTVGVRLTLKAWGAMIRLATGRRALFGALVAAALLIVVPLRAVLGWTGLGEAGLTAREVTGGLWAGRLVEARFGAVALGDLDARLAFGPLFLGRARLELNGADGGAGGRPLHGAVTVSRHGLGVDDMTASLLTGQLFAPLPVTALDLDGATVHFREGVCEQAEGRVRATLAGEAGGVALPASLSGPARCEAGALVLALASQAGTEGATLRVQGDGRYRAEFALRNPDPATAARLEAAGFIGGANGYLLAVEGKF